MKKVSNKIKKQLMKVRRTLHDVSVCCASKDWLQAERQTDAAVITLMNLAQQFNQYKLQQMQGGQ